MLRTARRKLWSVPVLRRRLACFLLVLYVAALHALPALHLVRHHNDHVHELGGLRWIRPLPAHVHGAHQQHESLSGPELAELPTKDPRQHLRAAKYGGTATAALHLARGPAHAQSALLVPLRLVSLEPAAQSVSLGLALAAPAAGEVAAHHRARAPPLPV